MPDLTSIFSAFNTIHGPWTKISTGGTPVLWLWMKLLTDSNVCLHSNCFLNHMRAHGCKASVSGRVHYVSGVKVHNLARMHGCVEGKSPAPVQEFVTPRIGRKVLESRKKEHHEVEVAPHATVVTFILPVQYTYCNIHSTSAVHILQHSFYQCSTHTATFILPVQYTYCKAAARAEK